MKYENSFLTIIFFYELEIIYLKNLIKNSLSLSSFLAGQKNWEKYTLKISYNIFVCFLLNLFKYFHKFDNHKTSNSKSGVHKNE